MDNEQRIYTAIGLDFETGGLDARQCGATQVALEAVRLDTWQPIGRYKSYIAPYDRPAEESRRKVLRTRRELFAPPTPVPMRYDDTAMRYSGISLDMLQARGADVVRVATDILDFARRHTLGAGPQFRPVLIGQNIPFDIAFLQQIMHRANLISDFEKVFAGTRDYYGNFQPHYIDSLDLARMAFAADASVTSYKLEAVARKLGVELAEAHDAEADIAATLDIVRLCACRIRRQEDFEAVQRQKTRPHFLI